MLIYSIYGVESIEILTQKNGTVGTVYKCVKKILNEASHGQNSKNGILISWNSECHNEK